MAFKHWSANVLLAIAYRWGNLGCMLQYLPKVIQLVWQSKAGLMPKPVLYYTQVTDANSVLTRLSVLLLHFFAFGFASPPKMSQIILQKSLSTSILLSFHGVAQGLLLSWSLLSQSPTSLSPQNFITAIIYAMHASVPHSQCFTLICISEMPALDSKVLGDSIQACITCT